MTSMLPQLMTTDPDAEFPATPEPAAARMPVVAAIALDIIDEIAANTAFGVRIAVRMAPGAVKSAVKSVVGTALRPARPLLAGGGPQRPDTPKSDMDGSSPRTLLNAPITARRSVAFAAVTMDDLRFITDAFDITVNDLFLTATTSALRRWLQVHDTVPDQPLRTLMPISTRGAGDGASKRVFENSRWAGVCLAENRRSRLLVCVRDYETRPNHDEAMVHLAVITTMTRRLART